ncbi:cysteine-rich KTR domain-containing protein [Bacteroides acidifaciens]|uniref:cysteine-rich KTR domain-containing protein n=1 Tax=Bacteroides acidifaciens TaxID=85831 RepID=UPI0025AF4293|nr:cysteine-rich KTR domain-containing protein [Bacteroides acidifaciens]
MTQYQWVLCPICGGKTRTKIRPDTDAKNLIVFCPKCKRESVVGVEKGKVLENGKEKEDC